MSGLVLRSLIALFGMCAIAWAARVIPIDGQTRPLTETAESILSGNRFNARQLLAMERQWDAGQAELTQASALTGLVVIRLLLLEDQLKTGNHELSVADYDQLQLNVIAAIAHSPTNSFMWLSGFW